MNTILRENQKWENEKGATIQIVDSSIGDGRTSYRAPIRLEVEVISGQNNISNFDKENGTIPRDTLLKEFSRKDEAE